MILFLDFDGVLHPLSPHGLPRAPFSRLPLLEDVLRDFPEVRVVLATSWRHSLTLGQLRELFSKDIAPRVIGVTPDVSRSGPLYADVQAYVADGGVPPGEDWVALTCGHGGFPLESPHLVQIQGEVGMTRLDAARLRARLRGETVIGRLTIRKGETLNVYAFEGEAGRSKGYVRLAEMPEAFCTTFRRWALSTAMTEVHGEPVAYAHEVMRLVAAEPTWWAGSAQTAPMQGSSFR